MPVITPVRVNPSEVDLEIWKWIGMAAGDTALPVRCNYKQDKTVLWIATTVGTAVATIQGALDPAESAFAILHDTRGFANPLTITLATTATLAAILEGCYSVKPVLTGGATTAGFDTWLFMRGR
jgi:hypothetical protein